MKLLIVMFVVALPALMLSGCNTKVNEAGAATRKVADQRLATYNVIRRLTYKNACASEGPLSICVERILTSENATVVEVRFKNSSSDLSEGNSSTTILLKSDAQEAFRWMSNKPISLKRGEADIRFEMQGHLKGEPTAFIMSDLVTSTTPGKHERVSIIVDLVQ